MTDHTAETIGRLLLEHVTCRHGVPNELLSDRGADFLSELVSEVCRLKGMKKINTSAYHPQSDGMVERLNRTLTDMIAKHTSFYGPRNGIGFYHTYCLPTESSLTARVEKHRSFCYTAGMRDCQRKQCSRNHLDLVNWRPTTTKRTCCWDFQPRGRTPN